ncbi:MAG: Hsp20/alpha crystallin family protein [Armatimonadetes bacterium]|nr:Hsp20/alpha crystallin family protein [Armatimonadota bacterium]
MAEKTVATPADATAQAADKEATRADERYIAPPVDIYETPDGLVLVADLPGVAGDGLDVQVKNDILTISARVQVDSPGTPVYREFELANFYRQFQLADCVDADRISAQLRNGVLELKLPKAEAAKPKTIKVELA